MRERKPRASAERTPAPQADWDPSLVRGIVLDANAHGYRGVLNLEILRELGQEADEEDIEVWLAEPLLWEGVVHLFEVLNEAARESDRARGLARRVGIDVPRWSAPEDVEALLAEMAHAARLVPNLRILSLEGDDASSALKDQVLQTGPGGVKTQKDPEGKTKPVRTGALDSAWLRLVHRHSPARGSYVIVSDDRKDITKAFEAWGLPVPSIVRDARELRRQLFRYEPGKEQAAFEVMSFLKRALSDGYLKFVMRGAPVTNLHEALKAFTGEKPRNYDTVPTRLDLKRVVGVGDINISRTKQRISAQVYLLVDTTVSAKTWDENDETFVEESLRLDDSVLRVPLLVQVRDEKQSDGDVDGDIEIFLPTIGYENDQMPLDMMLRSLALVPGLLDEGPIEFPQAGPWKGALPDGRPIELAFEWLEPVGWTVDAALAGVELSIGCKPDALFALIPDQTGSYGQVPSRITVEGDSEMTGASKEWALAEFLIRNQFGL